MVRVAVLGCGRIGKMHARNVAAHPRMTLVALHDIHEPSAQAVAKELGVRSYKDAEPIFESKDIDAVLIATATDTHIAYLEKAVASGKAVLCEKPIDLDLKRVDACAAKIRGNKTPIMLGFVRRFDPGHRACRQMIKDGKLGELHQVIITSRDPGMAPAAYIAASGGIFRDMTIHDFDMARFILGEEPTEVFATGSRMVDPKLMERTDDFDTVTVVLRTGSGKQCIINNSRQAAYGYDQRVEALGAAGMATSENRRAQYARLYSASFTEQSEPYLNFFIERYVEAFSVELGAFADCVETGAAPEVGFEDGRLALVLAEAALKSAREGRLVKVSEVG
jgi:myo-inositol 2-dehydrogenase / D-chiro-inositol 1-dehydrogenase